MKTTNVDKIISSSENNESVNERLIVLVQHFEHGKKAAFARAIGISPQAAQEILAGRRSEPSFKVLVKILQAYPQVTTDWLVLGRGPMLQNLNEVDLVINKPIYASYEQFVESLQKSGQYTELLTEKMASTHPEWAQRVRENQAAAIAKEQALMRVYSIASVGGLLLAERLNISENEALELIHSGKLRGTPIGEDYRVTEKAVREFLGEA